MQHVEYARDIAERFNHAYGERFALTPPRVVTSDDAGESTMPGLDGRKMSKSYDNTIPLFAERDELQKLVRRLKTDSTPVEAPKDPDASSLFAIYRQFAGADDQAAVRARLSAGRPGLGRDEGHRLRERRRRAGGPARAVPGADGRPRRAGRDPGRRRRARPRAGDGR